ncbi:NAD(P)-dependent oxidoreductase [Dinghuibacter silviterrae]|uniref:Alanine dehydrogenase n=1 Tax=Dinghuibacter silviterrae TaxID=1539049 RepID=A0A4R8DGF5_9BACT|nr:NAD(P)-dependent oxidoreductase [Dinghuibacter silviterrae]TDW96565.1 alanine dehydrogenase [Dinghuibacter silviterrae]
MLTIGLIKEGKVPADNRVAFTPHQCQWLQEQYPDLRIVVQSCPTRCFSDREYQAAGIKVQDNLEEADILLGIKEVPKELLIPGKTYFFFSHTKKKQAGNQALFRAILREKITLIDYECLTHEDGQRILGFGFFAGVVGAHNGIMAYGRRTGAFALGRVYQSKHFKGLIHTYFELRLPPLKVAVTGTGRVSSGVLEIMNLMGIKEVEPEEYLRRNYAYPVFAHLRGQDLYKHKLTGGYSRESFHLQPGEYACLFEPYLAQTDVLMNGIYWSADIPPLFMMEDMRKADFRIATIADITNDLKGSIPCNIGDSTMEDPVYGVDKQTGQKTAPYLQGSVDVMAVGNLPNELPRDASQYFGEQFIKFVLPELWKVRSDLLKRATMVREGQLTEGFRYLEDYAGLT